MGRVRLWFCCRWWWWVSRELDPEDVRIYRKIFLKMNRELCKKTKDKYFNYERVVDVDSAEQEKAK